MVWLGLWMIATALLASLETLTLSYLPADLGADRFLFEIAVRGVWGLVGLLCLLLSGRMDAPPSHKPRPSAPAPRPVLDPRPAGGFAALPELPWEPPLELGEVVAERAFQIEYPRGVQEPILLRLGKPVLRRAGWACPYRLVGLSGDYVHAAYGADAFEALSRAVHSGPDLVEEGALTRGGRVLRDGTPGLGQGWICVRFLRERRRRRRRGEMGALCLDEPGSIDLRRSV